MLKFSPKITLIAAAAGLAIAPVAAQAGTRAAAVPVAADVARVSAPTGEESELRGAQPLLWLALLLAAIAIIIAASGGKSRG